MCATCEDPRVYGQTDAKQLAAIQRDKQKLKKVQSLRSSKANVLKKNKQTKRIK